MAVSGHHWDAAEVLKIQNIFTCVGYAPSKRRKCQNPIAAAKRAWASEILDRVENKDVVTTSVKRDLEELAPRLLCQRYHQGQASTMVNGWLAKVENLKAERMHQRNEVAALSRMTSEAESTRVRLSRSQAVPISNPSTTSTRVPEPVAAQLPATPRRQSQVQQLPSPPATPIRRTARTNLVTSPSPPTQPASLSETFPPVAATSAASPPATSPQAVASPPAAPAAPEASLTPLTHNHQEPDDPTHDIVSLEECSICYEDIPANTGIASDCDHHFHASCINTWLSTQDASSQAHICPYCRSEWTRRKVEGDCSICCDSLLHDHDDDDDDDDNNDENGSTNEGEAGLVWCKSGCTQNFHRGCINSWLAASAEMGVRRRCPDCRADWVKS